MHTANETVEKALQKETFFFSNIEDGNSLTKSVNRVIIVMTLTIHTVLKKTVGYPFISLNKDKTENF